MRRTRQHREPAVETGPREDPREPPYVLERVVAVADKEPRAQPARRSRCETVDGRRAGEVVKSG